MEGKPIKDPYIGRRHAAQIKVLLGLFEAKHSYLGKRRNGKPRALIHMQEIGRSVGVNEAYVCKVVPRLMKMRDIHLKGFEITPNGIKWLKKIPKHIIEKYANEIIEHRKKQQNGGENHG